MRTLLVERRQLPRPKVCGGCLAPAGIQRLRALGMIDSGFNQSTPSLNSLRLSFRSGSAVLPIRPYQAVDRRSFDESLVERAAGVGAEVLLGARATVQPDDRVRIDWGSSSIRLAPDVVVVADGLAGSALAERTDFDWRAPPTGPIGLGAIVSEETGSVNPDEILMVIGEAGYVGFAPIGQGMIAIGAAVSAEAVKHQGPSFSAQSILKHARIDDGRLSHIRWSGVSRLTRSRSRYASGRVLVVGDAVQYVEPLTGEGMSWAILCASSVAPHAERAARGIDIDRAWTSHCRNLLRSRSLVCRAVTRAARSPTALAMVSFLSSRSRLPGLVSRSLCWELD